MKNIIFYLFIFTFFMPCTYLSADAISEQDEKCKVLKNKAQQGILSDDEKVPFRSCVLKLPQAKDTSEASKALRNAQSDIIKGPGPNNDLVGKEGWLRIRLGF